MAIEVAVLAGEEGIEEILRCLAELDEHPVLAPGRIEAADLRRLHAQQGNGFAAVHVFQQDDLPVGELGS